MEKIPKTRIWTLLGIVKALFRAQKPKGGFFITLDSGLNLPMPKFPLARNAYYQKHKTQRSYVDSYELEKLWRKQCLLKP